MSTSLKLSRRQFAGTVAAGTAGVMMASASRACGFQSPNERPVFATIGLRNQGWEITNKTTDFADFAAFADVDANVLGTNIEKLAKKTGKKKSSKKKKTSKKKSSKKKTSKKKRKFYL